MISTRAEALPSAPERACSARAISAGGRVLVGQVHLLVGQDARRGGGAQVAVEQALQLAAGGLATPQRGVLQAGVHGFGEQSRLGLLDRGLAGEQ